MKKNLRRKKSYIFQVMLFISLLFSFAISFSGEARAAYCSNGDVCKSSCDPNKEDRIGPCDYGLSCCRLRALPVQMVSTNIENPLELDTVEEVLDSVLGSLQAIIAILSIIFIVIGGILYITASGDEGRVRTAKGAITAAMVGLALGIGAPSFLKQIGEVLGWGEIDSGPVAEAETLAGIATNVLNFLLSIVGVIGIIMLVIGGLMYLTAAGDEDRINTGKRIVNYSIIGIAVALAALVIVTQIAAFLSGA
jgi:hypothetical protein